MISFCDRIVYLDSKQVEYCKKKPMYSHKKHEDGRVKSGWEKRANEISNYPIKKKKKKGHQLFPKSPTRIYEIQICRPKSVMEGIASP